MKAPRDPSDYGERIARVYDERFAGLEPGPAVDLLVELAENGRVLELGIGTGRLALPLSARGVAIEGVDASPSMVERMRAKPGGADISVTIGDFADVSADGDFALVFVAFNTLFALTTQEDQVRCFRNVAARLRPGGRFVIEVFVPNLARFDAGQCVRAVRVGDDSVLLEVSTHDPVGQKVTSQTVDLSEQRTRFYPVTIRYAWPSELDLMAQLAGLDRESRWSGWTRQPFTAASGSHVTVYRKAR